MAGQLQGKRVAALVANGFEDSELSEPVKALRAEGAQVDIVSPEAGKVRGWRHHQWGDEVPVDRALDAVKSADYDAVLLPGGVMNPDRLRTIPAAVAFVREAFDAGKPIAAICHGPWTLIDAGVVEGLQLTSWPSLRTDLTNAGASWTDQAVVVDQGVVTSRKPDDLPAFNERMIAAFAEGEHADGIQRRRGKFWQAGSADFQKPQPRA
jgi:protease I